MRYLNLNNPVSINQPYTVKFEKIEDKRVPYIVINEDYKVYLSHKFLSPDKKFHTITFPIKGEIVKTKKGNLFIRHINEDEEPKYVYHINVLSGIGGKVRYLKIVADKEYIDYDFSKKTTINGFGRWEFQFYAKLVNTIAEKIIIIWRRTGFVVNIFDGKTIIYANGNHKTEYNKLFYLKYEKNKTKT